MLKHCPPWLSEHAKDFWTKHKNEVNLTDLNREMFGVCCEQYAEWRNAQSFAERMKALDLLVKLAREFNILPRTARKTANKPEIQKDEINQLFA